MTPAQYTLFVAYIILLCLWTAHFISSLFGYELFGECGGRHHHQSGEGKVTEEGGGGGKIGGKREDVVLNVYQNDASSGSKVESVGGVGTSGESTSAGNVALQMEAKATQNGEVAKSRPRSSGPPPVTVDRFLTSVVLFGAIMFYFYICDYLKVNRSRLLNAATSLDTINSWPAFFWCRCFLILAIHLFFPPLPPPPPFFFSLQFPLFFVTSYIILTF